MSANLINSMSKLFDKPITNFWVEYDGYLLGKSTGTLEYNPEFDIQDIIYAQDGTKAEDHVYTGSDHLVSVTLSEKVNENLFSLLVPGWEHVINSSVPDSILAKSLYVSLKATRGRVLKIIAALPDGSPSTNDDDIITLYTAIPLIDSAIFKFGADQQQEMPVNFRCKTTKFSDIEGSLIDNIVYNGKSISQSFGYLGDPTRIGIPEAVVIDRSGPALLSATIVDSETVSLEFNKDIDTILNTGAVAMIKFDGTDSEFVLPTGAVINGVNANEVDLTFAATTFLSTDISKVFVGQDFLKDANDNTNQVVGIGGNVENTIV